MAKNNHKHTPPKPPPFACTPFSSLRGVTVHSKPAAALDPPAINASPAQSDEKDYDLFLQAMAGTRPLRGATPTEGVQASTGNSTAKSQPKSSVAISPEDTSAAELFIQEIGRLKLEVRFSETSAEEDELKPLSGNRLKQLKRGVITVDHQLDLHGLTRDEALAALPRFLRSARLKGQIAALVITGKGLNSPGEPVLQQAIAAWLRDTGRELVIEYAPAPREMGGSGAFIVFLRPLPKSVA